MMGLVLKKYLFDLSTHSFIKILPGSDIQGVPASEMIDTFFYFLVIE